MKSETRPGSDTSMLKKHIQYPVIALLLLFAFFSPAQGKKQGDAEFKKSGLLIKNVRISPSSFNPSLNQKTEISFDLLQDAKITVNIFDPDGIPVKTLSDETETSAGTQKTAWNGKDKKGNIVPDEAYSFTIKAVDKHGNTETWKHPPQKWKRFDIPDPVISKITNTITYQIPKPCRTRIRIGIENGPLLFAPLDWHPKVAGEIMVHWDGWDNNRAINIWKHPKSKMVITNIELPDNTIITYGNRKLDYFEYCCPENSQTRNWKKRRNDPEIPVTSPAPLALMLSPRLKISFPMTKEFTPDSIPVLDKKTLVRVEVENKILLSATSYEIIFFIDGEFYSEEPSGISPYNWVWDISNVEKGEHILTVNLVSFNDQIGAVSQEIIVK
ncbi:MAG: hypothetical protein GY749_44690 [Desulfobacteraceae bacterium]|nr:hypothetical protein [Desulfobacteraceae bacterium]